MNARTAGTTLCAACGVTLLHVKVWLMGRGPFCSYCSRRAWKDAVTLPIVKAREC